MAVMRGASSPCRGVAVDDASLCVETCKASGWLGEVVVVVLIGARALWAERKRRELAEEKAALSSQKAELKSQVQLLSMRPPAAPVTIQIPAITSLATQDATQAPVQPAEGAQELIPDPGRK